MSVLLSPFPPCEVNVIIYSSCKNKFSHRDQMLGTATGQYTPTLSQTLCSTLDMSHHVGLNLVTKFGDVLPTVLYRAALPSSYAI